MERLMTENGNDCNLCADRPAVIKITASQLKTGIVLDAIDVCKECLEKFGSNLELTVGNMEQNTNN